MAVYIRSINPGFTNPFPPTIDLIKEFVERYHPPEAVVYVDTGQLSGGLSGAVVARFSYSGMHHVAKIDRKDQVLKEIGVYQNHLANRADGSRRAEDEMARLIYPEASVRSLERGEFERSLICKKGYDNEFYSICCYSYAKKDVADEELWPLDSYIKDKLETQDIRSNLLSDFDYIISKLSGTLDYFFYDLETEQRNLRKFELPAIPWEQFLPLACAAGSFHQGWLNFVKCLPDVWQKITAKQNEEPFAFFLSHGDLRCANIMIAVKKENHIRPFLIDYGLTAYENAMYDFARLESDMVQRILLRQSHDTIRDIILKLTEPSEFNPDDWKDDSKGCFFLQMISVIRSNAKKIFHDFPEEKRLECYELYLLGHATRMIRNDDPALRSSNTRYFYLWYVLRLFERIIRRIDKKSELPELTGPIDPSLFSNIKKWELKHLYYGNDERNKKKKYVLENDKGPIRLLAHTAHSYLDSNAERFYPSLLKRLSKQTDDLVRIVLINPFSLEGSKLGIAEARGLLQGPEVDCEYHENFTEFFKRFRTCLNAYKEIREDYPNLELRITHYSPDATILLSEDNAFIEAYLIGNVYLRYHSEIKMTAPEYLVPKGSYLYKVAEDHFEFFWKRSISVNEYDVRVNEFKDDFMRSERLRRKIVSLHESWFAVDPIVGCPNRCAYCFLTPYKINQKLPFIYRTPEDSYARLKENEWFRGQFNYLKSIEWQDDRLPIPVACGNYTEMVSQKNYQMMDSSVGANFRETNNTKELRKLIENHCTMGKNEHYRRWPILCLMTKQHIPKELLDFIKNQLFVEACLQIAFFISISFLGPKVEEGAAPVSALIENFQNIADVQKQLQKKYPHRKKQIAGIHFWRPLITGVNDNEVQKNLKSIRDAGAESSVAIGLKLSKKLVSYFKSADYDWGALQEKLRSFDIERDGYELFGIETRDAAVSTGKNLDHPVYLNTSCAVSHAFSLPDYNATYSHIGLLSTQKVLKIKEIFHSVGLHNEAFVIHNSVTPSYIEIKTQIEQEMQTYLRQMLGIEVLVSDSLKCTHEWKGNTSRLTKGIYCTQAYCPQAQRSVCADYYTKFSEA